MSYNQKEAVATVSLEGDFWLVATATSGSGAAKFYVLNGEDPVTEVTAVDASAIAAMLALKKT